MTQEEKTAALDRLERLLRSRESKDGYKQNVMRIKQEIAALKAHTASE